MSKFSKMKLDMYHLLLNCILYSIVLIFFSFFQELILFMFVLVFYEKRFVAIKSVTFKYANNICRNGVKLDYSKFESKN